MDESAVPTPDNRPVPTPDDPPPPPPETAPRRANNRKAIVASFAVVAMAGLIYSKFGVLQQWGPFIPVAITSFMALWPFLFKDWKKYEPQWARWPMLLTVLFAFAWNWANQNQQNKDKAAAGAKVQASEKAQAQDTTDFLDRLQKLRDQIATLETKVATKDLQDQIATLKTELGKTQQALAPGPKAFLVLTYPGFTNTTPGPPFAPIRERTIAATAEGTVKLPFQIVNPSEADAVEGSVTIVTCDGCAFVKDPDRFRRLAGMGDDERFLSFPLLAAKSHFPEMEMELTVRRSLQTFRFGMQYRCKTCTLNTDAEMLTVHVMWPA